MTMLNVAKLIRTISKMEGSKGAMSLGKNQLQLMAQGDKKLAQALRGLENPSLDVAYKAKANYNVAAFRLKDGKEVIANGAASLQNPGTKESILKYRINIGENGKTARLNGFVDTGKKLDLSDVEIAAKRKNGVDSLKAASGDAYRVAAEVNERPAIELMERLQPGSGYGLRGRIIGESRNFVEKLEKGWENIGKALSGENSGTFIKAQKIAPAEFAVAPKKFADKGKVISDFDLKKYNKIKQQDLPEELLKAVKSAKIKSANVKNPPKLD